MCLVLRKFINRIILSLSRRFFCVFFSLSVKFSEISLSFQYFSGLEAYGGGQLSSLSVCLLIDSGCILFIASKYFLFEMGFGWVVWWEWWTTSFSGEDFSEKVFPEKFYFIISPAYLQFNKCISTVLWCCFSFTCINKTGRSLSFPHRWCFQLGVHFLWVLGQALRYFNEGLRYVSLVIVNGNSCCLLFSSKAI